MSYASIYPDIFFNPEFVVAGTLTYAIVDVGEVDISATQLEEDIHFHRIQVQIMSVEKTNIDSYSIVVRPLLDDEYLYRMNVIPGDLMYITIGAGDRVVEQKKSKTTISAELVGMTPNSRRNDIEAKYEAYLDPTVAALCEIDGRKTRHNYYKNTRCQ